MDTELVYYFHNMTAQYGLPVTLLFCGIAGVLLVLTFIVSYMSLYRAAEIELERSQYEEVYNRLKMRDVPQSYPLPQRKRRIYHY